MRSVLNIINEEEVDGKKYRYILGKKGKRTLYVLAMNPSTATIKVFDQTVMKCFGLAFLHGYDGCVILNLLPIRESNSVNVSEIISEKEFSKNIEVIKNNIDENSDILACWGNEILKNKKMQEAIKKIYMSFKNNKNIWYCLKDTKSGKILTVKKQPRHISYLNETGLLELFDINRYIRDFN